MVAEKIMDVSVDEIIEYANSCFLAQISYNKQTKSIYFKDNDDNITCFIYSYLNNQSSVLATIRGQKINLAVPIEKFNDLFNKNKIFIVK